MNGFVIIIIEMMSVLFYRILFPAFVLSFARVAYIAILVLAAGNGNASRGRESRVKR